MKAKPNDMQAEQQDQPATRNLPVHTKARQSAEQASKSKRIGAKLKAALKAIVWEGQDIAPAARSAGLTGNALRIALSRPHVIQFLKRERDVFTAHARAQNIHHAVRLRECGNAMAELGAVKVIEQIGGEQQQLGATQASPGLVIVIGYPQQAAPMQVIEGHTQSPDIVSPKVSGDDR